VSESVLSRCRPQADKCEKYLVQLIGRGGILQEPDTDDLPKVKDENEEDDFFFQSQSKQTEQDLFTDLYIPFKILFYTVSPHAAWAL